jgi:RND superfamily putative drug exporter
MLFAIVFGLSMDYEVSDARSLKEIGLGLAVAIAIDATIVRVVLVPATMELLGRANWWLPGWLERVLPKVHAEGPVSLVQPGLLTTDESCEPVVRPKVHAR